MNESDPGALPGTARGGRRRKSVLRQMKAESIISEAKSALNDMFNSSRETNAVENVATGTAEEDPVLFPSNDSEDGEISIIESNEQKQIGSLNRRVEELVVKLGRAQGERDSLQAKLESEVRRRQQAEERATRQSEETNRARELLGTQLLHTEAEEREKAHEKDFWEKIATQSLLDKSLPPDDFKSVPLRVHPVYSQEIDHLRATLKKSENDLASHKSQMEALLKERTRLKTTHVERFNELHALLSAKRKQLVGAVRRIDYLVKELKSKSKESSDKDRYILRLEKKLIEMSRAQQKKSRKSSSSPHRRNSTEATKAYNKIIEKQLRMERLVNDGDSQSPPSSPVALPDHPRHASSELDRSIDLEIAKTEAANSPASKSGDRSWLQKLGALPGSY